MSLFLKTKRWLNMRKKLLILSVAVVVLCITQAARSETYFGAYKNVFGGELV